MTPSTPGKTEPEDDAKGRQKPGGKRRYEKPRLTDYGRVSKLTQGGTGSLSDGKRRQVCL